MNVAESHPTRLRFAFLARKPNPHSTLGEELGNSARESILPRLQTCLALMVIYTLEIPPA